MATAHSTLRAVSPFHIPRVRGLRPPSPPDVLTLMASSLRVKLLGTLAVAVAVALGTVALTARDAATTEFERYVTRQKADVQSVTEQLAERVGDRLILADSEGRIMADSARMVVLQRPAALPEEVFAPASEGWIYKRVEDGGPEKPGVVFIQASLSTRAAKEAAGERVKISFPSLAALPAQLTTVSAATGTGDARSTASISGTDPAGLATITTSTTDTSGADVTGIATTTDVVETRRLAVTPEAAWTFSAPAVSREVQSKFHFGWPVLGKAVAPFEQPLLSPEELFARSFSRTLFFALPASAMAAVFMAYVLSRRILRPVDALTVAARRLEAGDLSQRVAFTGKDEIGRLAHAFNAMADSLGRQEQLRRHMVTDVAHELRTPLGNVRGYLEALRDGVAEPTPELIDSLHEEAVLLSHLVDDLQELALAEAGHLTLAREPVAVEEVAQQALLAAEASASAAGVALTLDVPADVPTVDADPKRLSQVLRNLIANAVRHTPRGGSVTIRANQTGNLAGDPATTGGTASTAVSASRASGAPAMSGTVTLEVADTGEGIAPEHLPFVFERFYRADRSRARATGGAGLGLAIVKQLVEAHGGAVSVASTPGQGATFRCTLPAGSRSRQRVLAAS